jgi:hypothetical protein
MSQRAIADSGSVLPPARRRVESALDDETGRWVDVGADAALTERGGRSELTSTSRGRD